MSENYGNDDALLKGFLSFTLRLGYNDVMRLGKNNPGKSAYGNYVGIENVLDMTDEDVDTCMKMFGETIKGLIAALRERAGEDSGKEGDGHERQTVDQG